MTRKYLPYVLFGLGVYLVFLIMRFPASQAYHLVKAIAPQAPLILKGVQGTLWSGSASEAYVAGQNLSSLQWELSPAWLLLGRVQVRVGMRQGESYFYGDVGRTLGNDFHFGDVEARLLLEDLQPLAKAIPLQLAGVVSINLQELDFEDHVISGADGIVAWQNAGMRTLQSMTFGDLRLELQNTGEGVSGRLSDSGGALLADGTLSLAATGSYQFAGAFMVRDRNQAALSQNLNFLGRAGPDGKITVSRSGNLSELGGIFAKPSGS